MDYLHSFSPPVIHRDLKCNNVLIARDGRVKLADFGVSRMMPTDERAAVMTKVTPTPSHAYVCLSMFPRPSAATRLSSCLRETLELSATNFDRIFRCFRFFGVFRPPTPYLFGVLCVCVRESAMCVCV